MKMNLEKIGNLKLFRFLQMIPAMQSSSSKANQRISSNSPLIMDWKDLEMIQKGRTPLILIL